MPGDGITGFVRTGYDGGGGAVPKRGGRVKNSALDPSPMVGARLGRLYLQRLPSPKQLARFRVSDATMSYLFKPATSFEIRKRVLPAVM